MVSFDHQLLDQVEKQHGFGLQVFSKSFLDLKLVQEGFEHFSYLKNFHKSVSNNQN